MNTRRNCEFGMTSVSFVGNRITPKRLTQEIAKLEKFPKTMKLPATVRQVKRLVGSVIFCCPFMPDLAQNLMHWCILLPKDADFFSDDHLKRFETIKEDVSKAATTTLRLANHTQQ